jgi:RHS repeat-associated protein
MGGQYEIKDGSTKKYYSIAGMMVAVNDGTGLQYLLTDHLGSITAVTDSNGTLTSQQRYLPFGGTRAIPNSPILATDFGYTGQRLLDSGMGGIMDYRARFYSPALMKFQQPDTIIPDQSNPQSWNRFAYVLNNPVRFNDPTGHRPCGDGEEFDCDGFRQDPDEDPYGGGGDDGPGNVDNPPDNTEDRLDLAAEFNEYAISLGADSDYLNAETAFMLWIYRSGRFESPFWNTTNGYIIMSQQAALKIINLDPSQWGNLDPGVLEWVTFLQDPTEENFWAAHNVALRAGASQANIAGEPSYEQVFINKSLNNVYNLGDSCAAGSSLSCALAGEGGISLIANYNYAQQYPANAMDALGTIRYYPGVVGGARTVLDHYWSIFTGCVGVSVCYSP